MGWSSPSTVLHLPLVLLGLRTVPKDDSGLSVFEAVYGSPLTVPGEFLGSPELPPSSYLSKIERAVPGFAVPPPHHVFQSPPCQLPVALLSAKYVFVREDASIPSLAPVYRGPYLKLEQRDKFFRLQIGSGTDVVSVDCLKPVFSDKPVLPDLPPPHGRLALCALDPILCPPVVLDTSSAALVSSYLLLFLLPGIRTELLKILEGSALPFLLGGVLWRVDIRHSVPTADPAFSTDSWSTLQDIVESSISC